ncbi:hypothetical protein CDD80_2321 [Ophiocordyceps camponoti-rufipedis]|uniref:Thioredoxin domain-containing protein n=1 Tax=Ophiocordyceps camponoti-rufipedis TaxID=2004952 RepID=A0A2C5Z811_9HYPO|nr:hypothetical protein CDD80_2321 [Ophiocordyceps camponoti-rufipedis]
MSGPISIGSTTEWQSLLSKTSVVVADFYADWCGPCKMVAPHFERLAAQHSRPGKVAFAKVNVDNQSAIARAQGVSAMPTFKIFHRGQCIDTVKGANMPALADAVTKALRLADSGPSGDVFKTPGRTLGGTAPARTSIGGRAFSRPWDTATFFQSLYVFLGLYLVSLFSFDARKAAEDSPFNIHKKPPSQRVSPSHPNASSRPQQKSSFKTLADLGSE